MSKFKIGEVVCHKSNLTVKWVIVDVHGNVYECRRVEDSGKTNLQEFLKEELQKCPSNNEMISPFRNKKKQKPTSL